jgi:hypothetical protein
MIELFETMHISKQSLANNLIELLENMVQRKKKIAYVKDKEST